MVKTISLLAILPPRTGMLVANILKSREDPHEEIRIIVSPGSEPGLDAVAKKYGYRFETGSTGNNLEARFIPAGITMQEIDVTGETCPGPAISVATALELLAIGERLKVKSASADTISDIASAVTASGSKVISDGVERDRHFLIAEKAEKPAADVAGTCGSIPKDKVLIVQSNGIGNAERAYGTFIFSRVAQSMGRKVTIFFLMDGVSIARKGAASTVKHPDFDRLDKLMDEVIKAGATVYACELSAKFRGITPEHLADGVRMAGAATYLGLLSDPGFAVVNF